jgi:hypothetical protein
MEPVVRRRRGHIGQVAPQPPLGLGLDGVAVRDERYYGQKGGDLLTSQNGLQFNGEWRFAVKWASHLHDIGVRWYPNFPEVMSIATKVDWGAADLFPNFGMPPLA